MRPYALVIIILLAGCGDNIGLQIDDAMAPLGGDAGDSADGAAADATGNDAMRWTGMPIDLDSFGADYFGALCTALLQCDLFTNFLSIDECVQYYDIYFDGIKTKYLRELGAGLANGTIQMDMAVVSKCLEDLKSGICPSALASPACSMMLTGFQAEGSECYINEECAAPGAACEKANCEHACCAGTCQGLASLGERCSAQRPCVLGAYCVRNATGESVCQSGAQDSPCNDDFECRQDMWCNRGTCASDLQIGEPCTLHAQCSFNSLCVGTMIPGNNSGRCARVSQPDDICDSYCFGAMYCDAPDFSALGRCRQLPVEGENCYASLGRCSGIFLSCDPSWVCKQLPGLGEACVTGVCAPGLVCTSELTGEPEGICTSLVSVGERCTRDGNCASYVCAGSEGSKTCREWMSCRGAAPESAVLHGNDVGCGYRIP
jgi:hypothetical protein